MTSIKITDNKNTRKILIDDTSSWDGITERLSNVFSLDTKPLVLTYTDQDNDVIMLSTMIELQEAIHDNVLTFCLSSQVSKICFHYKSKKKKNLHSYHDVF